MSLTKLTDNLNNVSSLPDKPTLDADELKSVFDESGNTIKEYINTILTTEIDNITKDILSKISNNTLDIATKMSKSGDTMSGDLDMKGNAIQWKEEGYGDKFRIVPNFSGSGDSNVLVIQSTVGGVGEDPTNWKDLAYIHADTGEIDLIGKITGEDYYGKVNGKTMDLGTENNSDTWLLVLNGNNVQHRSIDNIINTYVFKSTIHYHPWQSMFLFRTDDTCIYLYLIGSNLLKAGNVWCNGNFNIYCKSGTKSGYYLVGFNGVSFQRFDWGIQVTCNKTNINLTSGEDVSGNGVGLFTSDFAIYA